MTQAIMTVSHLLQDALEGLVDLVRQWRRNRARKAMIATTRRELRNLTDHELRDLGIGRSDIESIARGTFNDNRMTARTNKDLRGWV
jgi:uncharacterized protein YjiS (DUF1127 family)